MPASVFHFKQFSIEQDRCAMKVGTDGVLLGSWAAKDIQPKSILDVGAGTGLISLMMAQRFPEAVIKGLEIEEQAAHQAAENVSTSPFANRIEIEHFDFFVWKPTQKFDLIISNPPFYKHAHSSRSAQRDMARHGITFPLEDFFATAASLLSNSGRLAVIVPANLSSEITSFCKSLRLSRICRVSPNQRKPDHRVMLEFGLHATETQESRLTIETDKRHHYSPEYKMLTRDFYINF